MVKRSKSVALTVKEPEVTHKNPDEYIDFTSALIRYGLLMSAKAKNGGKLLTDGMDKLYGIDGQSIDLTSQQVQYLNMRMDGLSTKQVCKSLQLDPALPMLWEEESEKNSLYYCCLTALETLKAKDLEDIVLEKAMTDNDWRRDTVRMFALKRFMPEYRENSPSVTSAVQVNISVANQPFEVVTETKEISDVD
jgi:hypothetical protein